MQRYLCTTRINGLALLSVYMATSYIPTTAGLRAEILKKCYLMETTVQQVNYLINCELHHTHC